MVISNHSTKIKDLYFVDFNGKIFRPKNVKRVGENIHINVSSFTEGMYILEIITKKEVNKFKVIIQR